MFDSTSKKLLNINFGVSLSRSRRRPRNYFNDKAPSQNRWVILFVLLSIFLLVFIGRLIDLQFIAGSYFRLLSEGNRIRHIPIKAARGEILDKNGNKLAQNIPIYKLATFSSGGVVTETQEIERGDALKIQAENGEEATRLLVDTGREYPLGEAAAHLVGYTSETAPSEIGEIPNTKCQMTNGEKEDPYQLGDSVGRMGIEQEYDCLLRGQNGEELIEVDARGRLVRKLGRREPIAGNNIYLTIDSNLQKASYEALLNAPNEKGTAPRRESGEVVRGAVVVENPQTGEVLALVSAPSFNPANLKTDYANLSQDKNLPFFNRAISGAYHPGSTFKIVTSTAALETGKIDRNFTFRDVGFIELGGIKFRNWLYVKRGGTEGEINIIRALTRSTDTFFYKVGEITGIDKLAEYASVLGLGRETGIDLPGEAAGLMPTPEWKLKTKGERWFLGNTYNASIGQGDVTATPLQILQMTGVVANDGKLCRPHLLSQNPNDKIQMTNKEDCRDLALKSETLQVIHEGMLGACAPGGTAGAFFNFTPQAACKTGTAQTGPEATHAWFTVYGPAEGDSKPTIAATAVVEEGGEGSVVAAPIVKEIFEKYFNH